MESLLSVFANQSSSYMTKLRSITDHSCYKFIVPEDLRPQELSHISDEREESPPRRAEKYPWYIQDSSSSEKGSVETTSPITPLSSPSPASSPSNYHYGTTKRQPAAYDQQSNNFSIDSLVGDDTSSSSSRPASSPSSYNYNINIKQEESPSLVAYNQYSHPFSIESLVGDVIDKKADPSRPAEVFRSTYLDDEVNRYIMWQSYLTRFYSQPGNNSPPKVTDHKVTQHTAETHAAYWCHVCNALCMDTDDVVRHRYVHVTKGDKCRLRSSLFRDHGCVTAHTRLDDDRIQCGMCDKVVSQCYFSKHQGIHEGHFCEECGKEFSTNSRLRDHMNVHNGKTPFTCTICDRSFAKRSSWTQHQRYHRDHRSFECQFCKKRFNSKYACAVHERLHTGENPYTCEFPGCNRSYPQKIQLKLHMNAHK